MAGTLRKSLIQSIVGLASDAISLYAPLGASGGPSVSPLASTSVPNQQIAQQEVSEALARRRIVIPVTDGGTAGTGVAEEPILNVPGVVTNGISTSLSQGIVIKAAYFADINAVASGIVNALPGFTLTLQKRSPAVTSLAAAQIALATTQANDLTYSTGTAAFQPALIPIGAAGAATTTTSGSNAQAITGGSGFTLNVTSTAGFLSQGALTCVLSTGAIQVFSYTGISATTFTGCLGPACTLGATGVAVVSYQSAVATMASGMNTLSLPQATITVAACTGFPPASATQPGNLLVTTTTGIQAVQYTGMTSTTFTGCTGGNGVCATGGLVTGPLVAEMNMGDVLTFTLTKVSTGLAVASATANAALIVEYEEN
jgi:hypothetical protein